MDEEKKIMEKRSSFRGWKERNAGKLHQKRNAAVIVIIASIFFAIIIYPYLSKITNDSNDSIHLDQQNNTSFPTPIKQEKNNTPSPTPIKNVKTNKSNITDIPKKVPIGKMGIPLVNNGFEITVKSVNPTNLHIDVWISLRNLDNKEKQFKLGPGTVLIDNIGQQYENIKVARSAEITQTNLADHAMKEGAVFFERLKEDRIPKRLILNINNEKVEFLLNSSNN